MVALRDFSCRFVHVCVIATIQGRHGETEGRHRETEGRHRETEGRHRETEGRHGGTAPTRTRNKPIAHHHI